MPDPPLDGSLRTWPEIADRFHGGIILLGNGLSINVWPDFAYGKLFDHAGELTPTDLELFAGTPNFERVLADLNTAIRVNGVANIDSAPLYEHYRRIQRALGHAVREVHFDRSSVPDACLQAIREELVRYEWIFTTSYDLLIYWAMSCGADPRRRFEPFVDLLRWGGDLQFDPERTVVKAGEVPVYFLHGALHLVVGGTGVTRKLRRSAMQTVLGQFGEPIEGDPQARPLLVTEGSARDKLRAIEGNAYLSHALHQLRTRDLPVVVFGSSLSPQDDHLVAALNELPGRPVAVSLRPGRARELATAQADLWGRFTVEDMVFFDATTHPLGGPALRVS